MELDKKKLIIALISGAVVFIALMVFMVFAFRAKMKEVKPAPQDTVTTESTAAPQLKIRIDGIANLYFIPLDQRYHFSLGVENFLTSNSIEHDGVIMQVGQVENDTENGVFKYNLYVPKNEVYIAGKYYSNLNSAVYEVEKNEQNLDELNSAPCNPGNIDYQEAPGVENIQMPVIIMNENALSGSFSQEQIAALKAQLEGFLMQDYEFRREVNMKDGTLVKDGDKVSFLMSFGVPRLDKKGIQVKYENSTFYFAFVTI